MTMHCLSFGVFVIRLRQISLSLDSSVKTMSKNTSVSLQKSFFIVEVMYTDRDLRDTHTVIRSGEVSCVSNLTVSVEIAGLAMICNAYPFVRIRNGCS